jgi:hypothetical protein
MPTAAGAGSDERVEAAVAARRAELAKARESSIGLLARPVLTLSLFGRALSEFALTTLARLAGSRPVVYAGYPLLLGWLITRLAFPDLYAPPTCIAGSGTATAAAGGGPLYLPALYVYEFGWWLVLGILSSIGFGSGLHSGIMFLWPFVMRVVAEVEVCAGLGCAVRVLASVPCPPPSLPRLLPPPKVGMRRLVGWHGTRFARGGGSGRAAQGSVHNLKIINDQSAGESEFRGVQGLRRVAGT